MVVLGILYVLAAGFWTKYLPGYALSKLFWPKAEGMTRHGLALVTGFVLFSMVLFFVCTLFRRPMDATALWIGATAINVPAIVFMVRSGRGFPRDIGLRDTLGVLLLVPACALGLMFLVRSIDGGDVFSTIGHCLYVIVMHTISNDASIAVPVYDAMSGGMMHFLVPHTTEAFNGLAPLFYEQRLGNAALLGPGVALFGTLGWVDAPANALAVTAVFTWLTARELRVRRWVGVLASVLFTYGTMAMCMYHVNENYFVVSVVSFLVWAAVQSERGAGWAIQVGLFAGLLIGMRHTAVLFWPGIAAACLVGPASHRVKAKRLALCLACTVLATAPWLYVNEIMMGFFFGHPKIHTDGADRIVTNTLFGHAFAFRPLNWPFTGQIVRTPWNPFPTFLWIPLWAGLCYGQLFIAASLLGLRRLVRDGGPGRVRLGLLALFFLPHTMAISWLEGVDWEQLTYIAPGMVPLGILGAVGIDMLLVRGRWPRRLLAFAILFAAVVTWSFALRGLEFPVDTRLVERGASTPGSDRGTRMLRRELTTLSPLPRIPSFRQGAGERIYASLAALADSPTIPEHKGLPVYPSGRVVLHTGYSHSAGVKFKFLVQGQPATDVGESQRTGWYLAKVSLRLPGEQVGFEVTRRSGVYRVAAQPLAGKGKLHDFTFWMHVWGPPITSVEVSSGGRPLEGLRILHYGGTTISDLRWLVTNLPPAVADTVTIPFVVEPQGERTRCGAFLYLDDKTETGDIDTLVPVGGHQHEWSGEREGALVIPARMKAGRILLFSEPYCSSHIPQYGDRYAVVDGPFTPGRKLRFVLDRIWGL